MIIPMSLCKNPDKIRKQKDFWYAESRGMGIRTKVIPTMRKFNGTEPGFEATEDFLKTTLYNNGAKSDPYEPNEPNKFDFDPNPDPNEPNKHDFDPNLDPNEPNKTQNDPNPDPNLSLEEQILAILQRQPQATYNDIAQLCGKSMASVKRALGMLKKRGYIHRHGTTRSGSWQLLKGVSLEQSNKSSY